MRADFWTIEERKLAAKLISEKVDEATFKAQVGRSRAAYKKHLAALLERTGERQPRRNNVAEQREIPEAVLADARRRLGAERSITAELCGDPAPGQSALDRKRGGLPA